MPINFANELPWHRRGAKTLGLVHSHMVEVGAQGSHKQAVIADVGTIQERPATVDGRCSLLAMVFFSHPPELVEARHGTPQRLRDGLRAEPAQATPAWKARVT